VTAPARTKQKQWMNVVWDAVSDKYPGDPMRDTEANRAFITLMYLARLHDCAEGRCRVPQCPGVIHHFDAMRDRLVPEEDNA